MITVTYPNTIPFVGNRPYADVRLNPAYRTAPTYKCIVDTGADYLQLPAAAAAASGLSLASAVSHPITSSSGTATYQRLSGVKLEIEGQTVTVDVLFDPTNSAPCLAGRNVLLAAFELGLEVGKWHWV